MQDLILSHSKSFQQYEVGICVWWDLEGTTQSNTSGNTGKNKSRDQSKIDQSKIE